MQEPNFIYILALTTFGLALIFIIFSFLRSRRDRKKHVTSAVDRTRLEESRKEHIEPQPSERH